MEAQPNNAPSSLIREEGCEYQERISPRHLPAARELGAREFELLEFNAKLIRYSGRSISLMPCCSVPIVDKCCGHTAILCH